MNTTQGLNNGQEYFENLSDDVLKKMLEENENQAKIGPVNEKTLQTSSYIKLILASRSSSQKDSFLTAYDKIARYKELDKEWDRLDSTGRKDEQEEVTREMEKIAEELNEIGLDTKGNPIKSPEIVKKIGGEVLKILD